MSAVPSTNVEDTAKKRLKYSGGDFGPMQIADLQLFWGWVPSSG
jgi:hypothetical protein